MGEKEDRPDKPDWAWNSEPQRPWAQRECLTQNERTSNLKNTRGLHLDHRERKIYFTVVPVSAKPLLETNTYMKTENRRTMSWVELQESSGNLNQSDMNQRQNNLSTYALFNEVKTDWTSMITLSSKNQSWESSRNQLDTIINYEHKIDQEQEVRVHSLCWACLLHFASMHGDLWKFARWRFWWPARPSRLV